MLHLHSRGAEHGCMLHPPSSPRSDATLTPFCDAVQACLSLISRPFVAARFPPLVIQLGAFMLSAAWGLGLYAVTYFALKHSHAGHQVRCPVCLPAVDLSRMLCRCGHVPLAMAVVMTVGCSTWQPIDLVPQE